MTSAVCDASVVVKWFHHDGERDVDAAQAILEAHRTGDVVVEILDLTFYELGNVLARSLGWPADKVITYLADLSVLCGYGLMISPRIWCGAAIAAEHTGLTFYDAAYFAAADTLGVPLVTSDEKLLATRVGVSPTDFAAAL